uniref:Uncharacterized protein ycf35 n=1 Tax=Titanophycus setchellii TaxID=940129 RepID=A0A1G4NXX4_9FLOR|nr:Hypothetical protein ycf35 [Titanophycus setchellii]SCW23502.1 Hypothetical protein ycf35 [Titanophycus setchellii]
MSHLSKIKTQMTDTQILQDTLKEFQIVYTVKHEAAKKKPSIILNSQLEKTEHLKAEFTWANNNYELIADSRSWQDKKFLEHWQSKVYQQYAFNTIIKEGIRAGFQSNTYSSNNNNGTIKLVLEKWA